MVLQLYRVVILTAEEGDRVRGITTPGHALDPIRIGDGSFVLPIAVMSDPAHSMHHEFLQTLPQADLPLEAFPVPPDMPSFTRSAGEATLPRLDASPEITFQAVGVGLSAWEGLESRLATLYSIFKRKPHQLDTLAEFGREGRITRDRIALCEKAGAKFLRFDQGHEMRLARICAAARDLAINRHQLAHGIVSPMNVLDVPPDTKPGDWLGMTVMFGLSWPWYSRGRMHADAFMYGSEIILALAHQFAALGNEALEFAGELAPQP